MDEENGANNNLGFLFLYECLTNAVRPLTVFSLFYWFDEAVNIYF